MCYLLDNIINSMKKEFNFGDIVKVISDSNCLKGQSGKVTGIDEESGHPICVTFGDGHIEWFMDNELEIYRNERKYVY